VLEYRGDPRSRSFLAIAGKGICFDTGGLNVKPAGGMLLMKKDMGGAAAALGAARAVAAVAPPCNVRFYLAVAENSISGNALRPGDVVRALDGTTIEVGNTDAEGRLVLADAVALARREGAARIVDVATLTGAAMVALGRVRVPLLGSDEQLLADIEAAATATAERVWRMPTDQEYRDGIRGEVADLRNVGPAGEYGVMAGGLFVGHFAGDLPWAHLDISPASWAPAASEFGPAGATGAMVSTLARLAFGGAEEGAPVVRMPRRSSTPKRAPRGSSKSSPKAGRRPPRRRRTG
jgi:leucyl aminopeptidase